VACQASLIVGMPETAVRESKDRVRSAILSSHFEFPDHRITVNLAPADLPKGGGRFDLPIALGMLAASDQLPTESLRGVECLGELALNGALRATRGAVAATIAATRDGHRVALGTDSAALAARVPGSRLLPAPDLLSLCAVLRNRAPAPDFTALDENSSSEQTDLATVAGQQAARRALEITAAGGHNLLLYGPSRDWQEPARRVSPGHTATPRRRRAAYGACPA
jgi:magnesium chelatase family protein